MPRWTIALVLSATLAFAAPDKAEKQARAHFAAAQKAYDLGQFDQALKLYGDAYAAKPLPAFLFNIAQCHRQLQNHERALFFYRRFLSVAPPGTDTDTVDELISQVERAQADQAKADADRKHREQSAQETARQLEVEKAREKAALAEVEAAKEQALLVPPVRQEVLPPPPPPPPPETPIYKRWWLWAGVGVVAAGTATAVAIAAQPKPEIPTYGTLNAR